MKLKATLSAMFCFLFTFASILVSTLSEILVTGRCGRPGLPPKAYLHQISPERNRFDSNEKVLLKCPEDGLIWHIQTKVCKNGKWSGKPARCGKVLDAQVISYKVYDCQTPTLTKILEQRINQSEHISPNVPQNAFHYSRVTPDTPTSANNSNCYRWQIRLDRRAAIVFLIIDIYTLINETNDLPKMVASVGQYRHCELQADSKQSAHPYLVISYNYFCSINSTENYNKELTDLSDTISATINTNSTVEVGLDGIFIGELYTKSLNTKSVAPDCGTLEIQNTGVNIQKEIGYYNVFCNDSYEDFWLRPGLRHKFVCNHNGEWIGEWPVCVPIVTCPKNEIIDEKSSTVDIEEVANVYYLNSSQWFAINQTSVRYACHDENGIMVGTNMRVCQKNGQWSHHKPYCAVTSLNALAISGILFGVLILFILIVFIMFRIYTKRVKRDLKQAKSEIAETTRRRVSPELYADIRNSCSDNFYEMVDKSAYETVSYETGMTPRYATNFAKPNDEHNYLEMFGSTPTIAIN